MIKKRKEEIKNKELKNGEQATKLRVIIGSIAIAVICITGILYFVTSSPQFIFRSLVDKYYKGFSWALDSLDEGAFDINILKDSVIAKGSLGVDVTTNQEEIKLIQQVRYYSIGYDLGLDYKNKKAEAGLDLSLSAEKFLGFIANIKDDVAYVSLTGNEDVPLLFDKNIKIDEVGAYTSSVPYDDVDAYIKAFRNSYLSPEDADYIVSTIKGYISDSLSDLTYDETVAETITIDDKEVNATKYSLSINTANVKIIAANVLESLLANDEFLELVALRSSTPIDTLKGYLELAKAEVAASTGNELDTNLTFVIYTTGSFIFKDVVKTAVVNSKGKEYFNYTNYDNVINIHIDDNGNYIGAPIDINYIKGEETNSFSLSVFDSQNYEIKILTATIRSFDSQNIDFDFLLNLQDLGAADIKIWGTLTSSYADLTRSGTFKIDGLITGADVGLNGDFEFSKVNDNQFDLTANAKVDVNYDGTKNSIEINNKTSIAVGAEVATLDTANAVDYTDLTSKDAQTILDNFNGATRGTVISIIFDMLYPSLQNIYNEDGPIVNPNDCVDNNNHYIVMDQYSSTITNEADCGEVYKHPEGNWYYNYDNGTRTDVGKGEMINGECYYTPTAKNAITELYTDEDGNYYTYDCGEACTLWSATPQVEYSLPFCYSE